MRLGTLSIVHLFYPFADIDEEVAQFRIQQNVHILKVFSSKACYMKHVKVGHYLFLLCMLQLRVTD